MSLPLWQSLSYEARSEYCTHPVAHSLLTYMHEKQTNLVLAADVTRCDALLALAKQVGPAICALKTHVDTLEDFHPECIDALRELAKKERFILFEDRKFADIGHTVMHQYTGGMYRIAQWADLVTVHAVAGPGTITALASVAAETGRAGLLLVQMSAKNNLLTVTYQQQALQMLDARQDFLIGVIATQRLLESPSCLHFTPGIRLPNARLSGVQAGQQGGQQAQEKNVLGDSLGQQYLTPEAAVQRGSDLLIVGRGIYAQDLPGDPASRADAYRQAGWVAYQARCRSS